MDVYETYSTVLIVLTVALLLVASGIGKKQLVWKRPRLLPVRSRRVRARPGTRSSIKRSRIDSTAASRPLVRLRSAYQPCQVVTDPRREAERSPLLPPQSVKKIVFHGLVLLRNQGHVMTPRPASERLVSEALRCLTGRGRCRIADVGTGSGAIAIAVASACPDVEAWATDTNAAAVLLARRVGDSQTRTGFRRPPFRYLLEI